MVVHHLGDRGEAHGQLGEVFEHLHVPKDFDLLALGVGDHLARDVDAVWGVVDVKAEVVDQVGEVDLLLGGEAEGGDFFGLPAGDTWIIWSWRYLGLCA